MENKKVEIVRPLLFQKSDLKLTSSFGYATFVKNRFQVYKYLKSKKIQSRPLICGNMGQQPFWRKTLIKIDKLPNAQFVDRYALYLPNHANLSIKDVDIISNYFSKSAIPIFFK